MTTNTGVSRIDIVKLFNANLDNTFDNVMSRAGAQTLHKMKTTSNQKSDYNLSWKNNATES